MKNMVSIVIPVYNVEKYLHECIESILSQSYTDFEIILVDDGSTDSSGEICDSYANNPKVKVIHKQNAGLGLARNTGMEAASGKYVTFIDSDDYWCPNALEELMSAMEREQAETCIGGYTRVSNEGEKLLEEQPQLQVFHTNEEVRKLFFPRLMGSAPTKKDAFRPSVWNAVYSLNIIRENKLKFPSERVYIAEDIMFDLDYYLYANRVVTVPSPGYCYRVTPGSLTQKYKADRFEKVIFLYQAVFEKIKSYGYDDECMLRAKRQFFVYLRSCIKQESVEVSKLSKKAALKNIREICSNSFTKDCIKSYPVKYLGMKQKLFLFFVQNNMSNALYALLCGGKRKVGGKA